MDFLSRVLKDLADEYVMPSDRFYNIWDNICQAMRWDLPEPRLPNEIMPRSEDNIDDDEDPP